jgi:hypothetical protein
LAEINKDAGKKMASLAENVSARMREIDADISCSLYGGDESRDRPPEGNDYNLLWDAILDEFRAACLTIDVK